MKIKNKIFTTVLLSAISAGCLTACSSAPEPEATTSIETVSDTEVTSGSEITKSIPTGDVVLDSDNILNPVDMGIAARAANELNTGNKQYLTGEVDMDVSAFLREKLTEGQKPHTVVITCSDSRVPPELIFNADLGELFTIRTAGNVVGDYEVGSVEYAVDHLGSQLVLVMGHSNCGAVGAAVEGHASGNVASIVDEIVPSVKKARDTESSEESIAEKAEDLNVENTLAKLRESAVIKELEESGKIKLIGAKYDIDTGKVKYFTDNGDN